MWFMYVLSWLSLFIQVAFITLAVGESLDPGPRGLPSRLCAGRWSRHEGASPLLLAFASPCPTLLLTPAA